MPGTRGFNINTYGQDRIVLDWFGLADPFTQTFPILLTNTYTSGLYFQGQLLTPPSGYTSYSGINLGLVAASANATVNMSWDRAISGYIASSSPVTDNLTLVTIAFTSSNYTGEYNRASLAITNVLFNRFSGVIKLFGDDCSNDQPTPSLVLFVGGTIASGNTRSYVISYVRSGFETDVGSSANIQVTSGFGSIDISWNPITGVQQYYVWRYSGAGSFEDYSAPGSGVKAIELLGVTTSGSFRDSGQTVAGSGFYRSRIWARIDSLGTTHAAETGLYLSPPQSRSLAPSNTANTTWLHSYQFSKNTSGTVLLGPIYYVFHERSRSGANLLVDIMLNSLIDYTVSGVSITAASLTLSGATWYRHAAYIPTLNISGNMAIQLMLTTANLADRLLLDDIYAIAIS